MRVVPYPTGARKCPNFGSKNGQFCPIAKTCIFFLNFELNLVLIPSIYLLNNRIKFYDYEIKVNISIVSKHEWAIKMAIG